MAGDGETVSNLLYVLFNADNKVQTTGFNISYFHSRGILAIALELNRLNVDSRRML